MPDRLRKGFRAAAVRALAGSIAAVSLLGPARAGTGDITGAASPDLTDFAALNSGVRDKLASASPWQALRLAQRAADLPGLSASQRAAAFRDIGKILILLGDAAGAEENFRLALVSAPGDAEVSYQLAQTTRARPRESLLYAEQAARSGATARRRAAAQRLVADIRLDLDDAPGALSTLLSSLKSSGDDLDALEAVVRIMRDRPQDAAAYARRAVKAAETAPLWYRPAAYRLCARMWLEIRHSADAAESLRRALDINPDDLDALRMLLRLEAERPPERTPREGRPSNEALSAASSATEAALARKLESDPDDLEALRALVEIKRVQARPAEAAAAAERFADAVERAPLWRQAEAYRLLAALWSELGDVEKASRVVTHALDFGYNSIAILSLSYSIGSPPGRTARDDGPTLAAACRTTAQAQTALKRHAAAIKNLKRALELVPRDPDTLELLAEAERASNQRETPR